MSAAVHPFHTQHQPLHPHLARQHANHHHKSTHGKMKKGQEQHGKVLVRQRSFTLTDRIFQEFKGGCSYKGKLFKTVEAVNKRPKECRQKRIRWKSLNLHIKDSGWTGRFFKHIFKMPLWLIVCEITVYIFLVNVLFAWLFTALGGCCDTNNSFWDNFDFAFQTFTTVGYGELYPEGSVSNMIVFFMGIHNLVITTLFAGVVFTKFIRPRWKYKFSDVMVVRNVRGVPTLEVRFGNVDGEFTNVHSLTADMHLKISEMDDLGKKFRAVYKLDLVVDSRFELRDVWTIQHRIDPASPLFFRTLTDTRRARAMVFVSVSGVDDITEESMCKTSGYFADDIEWGYKFLDQVERHEELNITTFDYAKLSSTEPAPVYYPRKRTKRSLLEGVEDDEQNGSDPVEPKTPQIFKPTLPKKSQPKDMIFVTTPVGEKDCMKVKDAESTLLSAEDNGTAMNMDTFSVASSVATDDLECTSELKASETLNERRTQYQASHTVGGSVDTANSEERRSLRSPSERNQYGRLKNTYHSMYGSLDADGRQ
ncbi:hypothetical protein AAMO2058_000674200 [Amorphochlora amoebiformis]